MSGYYVVLMLVRAGAGVPIREVVGEVVGMGAGVGAGAR